MAFKSDVFLIHIDCVKIFRIWSFSDPHFPALRLNWEIYSVNLRIQSKCRKMRSGKTPTMDALYAVILLWV